MSLTNASSFADNGSTASTVWYGNLNGLPSPKSPGRAPKSEIPSRSLTLAALLDVELVHAAGERVVADDGALEDRETA